LDDAVFGCEGFGLGEELPVFLWYGC